MKNLWFAAPLAAGMGLCLGSCEKDEEKTDLITFEELDPGTEGYWNGSDNGGGFQSGNAYFPNTFRDWGGGITSWSGFAYSNLTDTSTPGFTNQYSCYAGSGAEGSSLFGIVAGSSLSGDGDTLVFDIPETITSISVANTTYAALSMKNGDQFAKRFGGADGTDPDFFKLLVTGIDADGEVTGTLVISLADFTSDDPGQDYISNTWTTFSLEELGQVRKLAFGFASTDIGQYGINTPLYACIDNIKGILHE